MNRDHEAARALNMLFAELEKGELSAKNKGWISLDEAVKNIEVEGDK